MKKYSTVFVDPRRRRLARRALGAAAVGALAWITVTTGVLGGASRQTGSTELVVDGAPGYAVEHFDYPQADKILAEKKILLKRGDGHITLADCAGGTGLLEIMARNKTDRICFKVVGDSGWLTLEIPAVYAIKGNDYTTAVDMTVGAEEKSFDVAKNTWTAVGESADPEGREHMLVEIRSSK
ncbi:hypothetical protein GCM10010269_11770 [Streptomyces humidus]|uniref:Secreted protein n=1 Tax=Streptomyces humidus TaxID=52259 RepID=A0A918FS30_9ACTN|nr:hypothetical protein [Streptomyces humidus]GGR74373.1 hypothetical protein GCM10010269_11770 [Streptomyces humidus]